MKILSIFFAVCGLLLLVGGIMMIVRKGKPLAGNKVVYSTDEERTLAEKVMFRFGIALALQAVVIFLVSASMYFRVSVLWWIGLGLMLPLSVYWIRILSNKKK